jgi:dimethylsulfoniopropionate demethylase
MVRMTHWDAGTELQVHTPEGPRVAEVRAEFFN